MSPSNEHISQNGVSLQSALASAHEEYITRNPLSQKSWNTGRSYLPGGNTRTVIHSQPFPLTFARGKAQTLISVDGDIYTDFLSEFSAGIYGHSCPEIKAAINEALGKGWNLGGNGVYEKDLARLVVERFSPTIELVRFTNSGTEANMMALGAAINYTGRKKILVFSHAYHGSTLAFPADQLPKVTMNAPFDFVIAPYNSISGTESVLSSLHTNSLAAILVEPMQGAGGCIPGSPDFLRYLREAATAYGAVLILDEVMTSRLAYGGRQSALGIVPDLTTLGKWVGGGMNFGAFGGRRDIMAMFDPSSEEALTHSGTFNNNVITMAAGIAGCKILTKERVDKLNARGDRLREDIATLIEKHGVSRLMLTTGVGSLFNVTFRGPDKDTLQALFYHYLLSHNIYIASRGYFALSLEITDADVERLMDVVEAFIVQYQSALA